MLSKGTYSYLKIHYLSSVTHDYYTGAHLCRVCGVCLLVPHSLMSPRSHWIVVCSTFFRCKERSDEFQVLYVLELKMEIRLFFKNPLSPIFSIGCVCVDHFLSNYPRIVHYTCRWHSQFFHFTLKFFSVLLVVYTTSRESVYI